MPHEAQSVILLCVSASYKPYGLYDDGGARGDIEDIVT